MSELDDRLKKLETELQALQRIKTQEDHDEGARLHELHNAPWRKGQYSHIQFPAYVFKAFPMMIYKPGYEAAVAAHDAAYLIPAYGVDDREQKIAVTAALRTMQSMTKIVKTEGDLRIALGQGWCESRQAAQERAKADQAALETADAQRAYADRRMTGRAAEERDRFEEQADNFVPEIPEQRRRPSTARVTRAGGADGSVSQAKGSSKPSKAAGGSGR